MISARKAEAEFESKRQKLLSWYSFLRISSTYQLATRYKAGRMSPAERDAQPASFEQVLQTHDKFGDVWAQTAESWFEEDVHKAHEVIKGANQPKLLSRLFVSNEQETATKLENHMTGAWVQQGSQPELLVSIPMGSKKSDIYKLITDALEDLRADHGNKLIPNALETAPTDDFQLLPTKVRLKVLGEINALVILRALEPELWHWQLAQKLGLAPALVDKVLKAQELQAGKTQKLQISDRAAGEKLLLNSMIGRNTRKAFVLAENAALGNFPCFDEIYDADKRKVKTHFDNKAIVDGIRREHFRQHGKRPSPTEFRHEFIYDRRDDDWWENYYNAQAKPIKDENLPERSDDDDEADEWPDLDQTT